MDALKLRLEVALEETERMALLTEFVMFCKELDDAEGTNTYDANTFALMAAGLLGKETATLEVA